VSILQYSQPSQGHEPPFFGITLKNEGGHHPPNPRQTNRKRGPWRTHSIPFIHSFIHSFPSSFPIENRPSSSSQQIFSSVCPVQIGLNYFRLLHSDLGLLVHNQLLWSHKNRKLLLGNTSKKEHNKNIEKGGLFNRRNMTGFYGHFLRRTNKYFIRCSKNGNAKEGKSFKIMNFLREIFQVDLRQFYWRLGQICVGKIFWIFDIISLLWMPSIHSIKYLVIRSMTWIGREEKGSNWKGRDQSKNYAKANGTITHKSALSNSTRAMDRRSDCCILNYKIVKKNFL
jgi:hypothetical protein